MEDNMVNGTPAEEDADGMENGGTEGLDGEAGDGTPVDGENNDGTEGSDGEGADGAEGLDGENSEGTEGSDGESADGAEDLAGDDGYMADGGYMVGGMDDGYLGGMDMMNPDGSSSGTAVKDPILSNIPFVASTISVALVIGIVLGILLGKKRIKKGFDIYEG